MDHTTARTTTTPTTTRLNIIQANLQHSQTATASLRRALEEQPQTIALIQEPWIRNNRICGLGNLGGKLILNTANTDTPRTCIYVPKTITCTPLTQYCSRDLTSVRLQTQTESADIRETALVSAYMPGDVDDCPPRELADVIRHCEDAGLEIIIGADANAHHQLWGMTSSNQRGEVLVNYLITTKLNLINHGSEPTWVTSRGQTIIDLTLASDMATDLISDWHVSSEASCSDHRRIRFSLAISLDTPEPKRNPRRTNIPEYRKLLRILIRNYEAQQPIQKIVNPTDLDRIVNKLSEFITEAYHSCCKLKTPSTRSKGSNWWNGELSNMRETLRKQFNRAKNTRLDEDWDTYKHTLRTFKLHTRIAKRKAWRDFCESIESNNEAARVRKILATDQNRTLGTLKRSDNTYTSTDTDTCKVLLETHFPDCNLSEDRTWEEPTINTPTEEDWLIAEEIVTADRLKWAIKTFKPYKSAGLDGIFPALLQWGIDCLLPWLAEIYRASLALGHIPVAWREVKVIFIPKPGKTDYTQPKSYRPISLSSFLLKTLERLCDRYIRDEALTKSPLHKNQHAYTIGKSTETALHSVVSKIETAINHQCSSLAAFIDIEGAFDKTTFPSISSALARQGVNPTLSTWITNMLRLRAVQVTVNGTTRATVMKGCPQGGVLSPLLWNLVVDSLIKRLNHRGYHTVGYADDITIIINGSHINTICNLMRQALKIVEDWCKEFQLTANPSKTELILFTKKRKIGTPQLPHFFGTTLSLSTETKYLGIYLDKQLSWAKHLEYITTKASKSLWQCNRLLGRNWGIKPEVTYWLYKTVIRPIITYGSLVWWPRTTMTTAQNQLEKLQRLACMAITGAMRTTPTAALEVMLGLPPLHLTVQQEAALATLRLSLAGNLSKDSRIKHTHRREDAIKAQPLLAAPCDRITKAHCFKKSYKIQLTEEDSDCSGPHELRIYTDGSKTANGTGAGVFSHDLNIHISKPLGEYATVYQAECVGITLAARAIQARKVTDMRIRIVSDSASVLQALHKNTIASGLLLECHQALESVATANTVTLQWIKGHSGSLGNDAADELARRGSDAMVYGPEPITPVPFSQFRSWLQNQTTTQHENRWSSIDSCRQSKLAMPNIDKKLTTRLLRLNRRNLRIMVGTITGHCSLNKHFYTIGVTDSPLCRACMEAEETVSHVLLDCVELKEIRAQFLGRPVTVANTLLNLQDLICFWSEVGWLE